MGARKSLSSNTPGLGLSISGGQGYMVKAMAPFEATTLTQLESEIHDCTRCRRLIQHCRQTGKKKRRAYLDQTYWAKPISGFGDPKAQLIIVGLAPAAHGANRTGRIFTGDRSGDWLYRALFKAGFANQPQSINTDDGLKLKNTWVTCAVKCAPPDNKPQPIELSKCVEYLEQELALLKHKKVYVALGAYALDALWPLVSSSALKLEKKPRFGHSLETQLASGAWLITSYHPSQQNTFTKRLTEKMFDQVFLQAKKRLMQSI